LIAAKEQFPFCLTIGSTEPKKEKGFGQGHPPEFFASVSCGETYLVEALEQNASKKTDFQR
jgi:hypothetical protein